MNTEAQQENANAQNMSEVLERLAILESRTHSHTGELDDDWLSSVQATDMILRQRIADHINKQTGFSTVSASDQWITSAIDVMRASEEFSTILNNMQENTQAEPICGHKLDEHRDTGYYTQCCNGKYDHFHEEVKSQENPITTLENIKTTNDTISSLIRDLEDDTLGPLLRHYCAKEFKQLLEVCDQ